MGLRKYQLPPMSSLASKQVYGSPQSERALPAVSPLMPAPITQVVGLADIREESRETGYAASPGQTSDDQLIPRLLSRS